MKRFYKKFTAVLMAAMLCVGTLTGCEALDTTLPKQEVQTEKKEKGRKANPKKALEKIYASLGKRAGLVEPTPEQLETVVGLNLDNIKESYVRYIETDFGANDVYILLPKPGENEKGESYRENVLTDLKERKDNRTREFSNYDVYNSSSIAENAIIFERGGYVVMLMTEDNDLARQIIEKYIPEKLNL